MKLRVEVPWLGIEIFRISLDIEQAPEPVVETVVEKGVQAMSRWWVGRMFGK
jgi:hypothetical protein